MFRIFMINNLPKILMCKVAPTATPFILQRFPVNQRLFLLFLFLHANYYRVTYSEVLQRVKSSWKNGNVCKLVIIKTLPKQSRNTKRKVGVSTPIKRLGKQPLSVITYCLKRVNNAKTSLNFHFFGVIQVSLQWSWQDQRLTEESQQRIPKWAQKKKERFQHTLWFPKKWRIRGYLRPKRWCLEPQISSLAFSFQPDSCSLAWDK